MAKREFRLLSRRPDISGGDGDAPVVDAFTTIKRPKLKFNFTVSLKFRPPIGNRLQTSMTTNDLTDIVTFAIKQASRPIPTVNYVDVNFYNYRTKVATKMDYGTMQVTFYDDVGNIAHNIYESYLKGISPIANIPPESADRLYSSKRGPNNKGFNHPDGNTYLSHGSIGPLPPGIKSGGESGLIQTITIRHWFYSQVERRGGEGENAENHQYVDYHFLNPKVINMTLDELDMAQSDLNTLMMNFVYDSVYIDSPAERAVPVILEPEKSTFTLNDIRAKVADAERLVRRVRRLDTIPDIPVIDTIGTFVGPIAGNLNKLDPLLKPDIDFLPDILQF